MSYILRMFGPNGMEYDVIVNGKAVATFSDPADAKDYCRQHGYSRRISNFRLEDYE